ncbi:TRAP transporter small permease [Halomonas sp. MCCC 1A11036]|uniref:TRAP transporter small permease protein n=1 Tax=Billgrantia zhangzhouensis TaxID=2733481 RepID=A0ABS9ADA2_9GAMM|nr:TRAP transporter small permease subunit [Halomonas zhangzhouensis]MCE8019183.1 TRAP transporter small permease [Halomonas zhangzhouensis]
MTSSSTPPESGLDRVACHLLRGITLVCDIVGVLLLAGVLLLIVAAVLARDVIGLGMPWTEEVASMLAIYAVAFGSLSAWVRFEHLVVDLFSHKLSPLARHLQYRLVALLSCGFFVLAAYGSLTMSMVSANNRTVSLGISFSYLYYGIFIAFAGMAVLALWQALRGPVSWQASLQAEQEAN